jgi:hypothetical protein
LSTAIEGSQSGYFPRLLQKLVEAALGLHRLEPLSLLLVILVRDCADEVVTRAVLVDLARVLLVALVNWAYLSPTS